MHLLHDTLAVYGLDPESVRHFRPRVGALGAVRSGCPKRVFRAFETEVVVVLGDKILDLSDEGKVRVFEEEVFRPVSVD